MCATFSLGADLPVSYEKCIKINSNYLEAYIGLGRILLDLMNLTESKKTFEKALKISPENTELHRYISMVTEYEKDSNHIKDMEKIFSKKNINQKQQIHLSFALGKAYEDTKQFSQAFSYWQKGNDLQRKLTNYSTDHQLKLLKAIKKNFTKELFKKFENTGNTNNNLIFIVGMPRSGTTLVQQILSSHPDVFGLGEKNEFFKVIKKNFFGEYDLLKKDLLNYDSVNFKRIGDEFYNYLKQVIQAVSASQATKNILVKDLLNFIWLGFIKIIFPNAKVIHCVRDPLDNCLSLYKNYFVGGVDFSYNLIELGEYYNLYKDIMLFWKQTLPNYYVDISYEQLLNNQKKETKKLLDACKLKWNEDCVNFHQFIHPMGAGDNSINIHKPIYKSSMQYWKLYEKQLKPLIGILNI